MRMQSPLSVKQIRKNKLPVLSQRVTNGQLQEMFLDDFKDSLQILGQGDKRLWIGSPKLHFIVFNCHKLNRFVDDSA